jgi:hypothetical protein
MNESVLVATREIIPSEIRKIIYVALSISGILLTAITAGYSASENLTPEWVNISLAMLGVLSGPFGLLAAGNVIVPLPEGESAAHFVEAELEDFQFPTP